MGTEIQAFDGPAAEMRRLREENEQLQATIEAAGRQVLKLAAELERTKDDPVPLPRYWRRRVRELFGV